MELGTVQSYLEALEAAIKREEEVVHRSVPGPHSWIHPALITVLQKAIAVEHRRLEGYGWRLS